MFVLVVGLVFVVLPLNTDAFEISFGECPIYFNEPCHENIIKFILSVPSDKSDKPSLHYLNPFKPKLPKEFNIVRPLKLVIHGYGGLTVDTATTNVTKAYQDVGYNVIIVDWEALSALPCYATAYLNTWHVGQCIAVLVLSLVPLGISPSFIHAIGFSLGAHIAGFAGSHLNTTFGRSFYRITGLDPALPFFATMKNEWKLDPSDAYFVDVVHTSAGSFGKIEASGHADFYMNGGSLQPFCYKSRYPPLCSHIMAGLYFAESIRNASNFVGRECDSITNFMLDYCLEGKLGIMGERTSSRTRGVYYVETSDKPPFVLQD